MSKFPLWTGGSAFGVIRLLCVIALGLAGLAVTTLVLGRVSANMAKQAQLSLSAYNQTGSPDETETPTPVITGTATLTPTLTLTATLTLTQTPTPGTPEPSGTPDRVTICHRTGSVNNPYVMITVDRSALPAHAAHGDIIPAPAEGCPAVLTPLPSGTVTVTRTPTPATSPLPTGTAAAEKVTICHHTGSTHNPYVMITISVSAIPAHSKHGDIIPAPPGGCPAVTPGAGPGNGNKLPPGQQKNKGKGNGKGNEKGNGNKPNK